MTITRTCSNATSGPPSAPAPSPMSPRPTCRRCTTAYATGGFQRAPCQYTHAVLTAALKQAVGWQIIPLNPADYTRRPKADADELATAESGKVRALDAKQAERFIAAAKADPMGAALIFAIATGARPEEYLALRWSDVDFDHGEVRISQVVQWRRRRNGGGFYFMPPKTRKSRRTLKVSDSVMKLLKTHRRTQVKQRLALGPKYRQLDLVFASSEGTPFQRRNLHNRHLTPVLEAAKLDKTLSLYVLRHTFCTLALAGGLDPKEVSMMMGHSSVAFTQDKYQHVLPGMREATSRKLEKLLFKNRVVGS